MSDADSVSTFSASLDPNDFMDPVSFEPFDSHTNAPITLPCGHSITKRTLDKLTSHGDSKCPVCRTFLPSDFNAQKNIILTNILSRRKKNKYNCPIHKDQKAKYVCLDEKTVFCEECLLNDKHSAHSKRKIERHFDELEDQTKRIRTSTENFGKLVIAKRKAKDTFISQATAKLQEGLQAMLTTNENVVIGKLKNWRKKNYEVIHKYDELKHGNLAIDFHIEECNYSIKELADIEKKYEEELGSAVQHIMNKITMAIEDENPHLQQPDNNMEQQPLINQQNQDNNAGEDIQIVDIQKDNDMQQLAQLMNKKMILNCENVTDFGVKNLAKHLSNIKNLESLRVDLSRSNGITDKPVRSLASTIRKLPSLTELILELSDCAEITDTAVKEIAAAVMNQPFLTNLQLDFSDCIQVSDEGVFDLLAILPDIRPLKTVGLYLCSCKGITDKSANHLAFNIQRLPDLQCLDISFNCTEVTNVGLNNILAGLRNIASLTGLKLFFNKCADIGDEEFKFIATILDKNRSLKKLYLAFGGTEVTDTGVLALCSAIEKLTNLVAVEFYLWELNVTDRSVGTIIDKLTKLNNIEKIVLDLASCDLVSDATAISCSTLIRCPNLKSLSLDFNETGIAQDKLVYLENLFKNKIQFSFS